MHRDERPIRKNAAHRLHARVLALLMLLLLPVAARAQWTTPDASGNTNTSAGVNNVGIGTDSPTSKLDVTGNAAVSGDLRVAGGRFKFSFSGPEGQMQGASERLSFWTPNSSAVQTMRMRIGGNTSSYVEFLNVNSVYLSSTAAKFGVGTSNPTSKMHLGSGTDSATSMLSLDTGTHGGTSLTVGGTANNESTLDMSVYRAGQYVSRFGVNNSGQVYLQPGGGNVGIGTSSPGAALDVRGSIALDGTVPAAHAATNYSSLWLKNNVALIPEVLAGHSILNIGTNYQRSAGGWTYVDQNIPTWVLSMGGGPAWDQFQLTRSSNNPYNAVKFLVVNSAGNVGIGAQTPAYKLDVAGLVRSSSGGFVFPDGTTQATAAATVNFGSTAGTAVQGNTTVTVAAGTGMSGGGPLTLGAGGTLTLTNDDRGSAQNIFKNVGNAAGAAQFSAVSNTDTIRFEGTGGTTVSFDANSRKVVINSASASSGWTDSGASVSPTSTAAKVGMGTSSPSAGLDVQTAVTNAPGAPTHGVRLQQTLTNNNNNSTINGLYINPTFNDGVAVGITHNALATGTGNVGIGTTATGAGLDVQNAGAVSGSNTYGARFQQTLTAVANNAVATAVYIDPTFSDGAAVGVKHNGLVVASGNVGIGTSTPLSGLTGNSGMELYAPSAVATFRLGTGLPGKNNAQIRFSGASGDNWAIGADVATHSGSRDFHFYDFAGTPGSRLTVQSSTGRVGIGTNTPDAKLDVYGGYLHVSGVCGGAMPNAQGAYLSWNQNCGTGETDLINHQGLGTGGFAFMNTPNGSTLTTLMSISGDGKVGIGKNNPTAALDVVGDIKATGSVSATYQDVAEWVPSTQKLAAGTVVVLDKSETNHVMASTRAYDTKVAGVVSAEPGVILGVAGEDKLKVATTGRVRVKVDARRSPVEVGDLLVTSEVEGVAMKSVEVDLGGVKIHRPGTIIGKALEPLASGTGEILVLLSLQ